MQHILISCAFARQVLSCLLQQVGIHVPAPIRVHSLVAWTLKQGPDPLIILGAYTIWKNRNGCFFDEVSPSVPRVLVLSREEAHLWGLAGARELLELDALI
ncbi:hypothetical protein BS78_10G254900 [Paspalum vaginatum]|nr:hypothetical protein BS78_10G254900 [Paspalum vaginatum]